MRVKTWRIMGWVYRNPPKKYDQINDVVCGPVNQRLLSGRTGSLTETGLKSRVGRLEK